MGGLRKTLYKEFRYAFTFTLYVSLSQLRFSRYFYDEFNNIRKPKGVTLRDITTTFQNLKQCLRKKENWKVEKFWNFWNFENGE